MRAIDVPRGIRIIAALVMMTAALALPGSSVGAAPSSTPVHARRVPVAVACPVYPGPCADCYLFKYSQQILIVPTWNRNGFHILALEVVTKTISVADYNKWGTGG